MSFPPLEVNHVWRQGSLSWIFPEQEVEGGTQLEEGVPTSKEKAFQAWLVQQELFIRMANMAKWFNSFV